MTRSLDRVCHCCGSAFVARNAAAKWCSARCSMRAYQRRRRGAPEADYGVSIVRAIRPAVLQPQILDDPNDLPLSWRQAEAAECSSLPFFAYAGRQVRVITDEQGLPWFVAADVCAVLGIATEQTRRLDDDEKGLRSMQTPGGHQSMTTVNESGLYSLILGSRKPEARAFKRWVTHEVLPTIRRTGSYSTPTTTQPQQLPEGVHVVAATQRRAAELWWQAIESEVSGALSRRLNPAHRSDAGLPLVVGYRWQQLSLPA